MKAIVVLVVVLCGCRHGATQRSGCNPPPRVVRQTTLTPTADSGVVEGTLNDAWSQKPIEQAAVLFAASQIGTRTDAKGEFRLARLPIGLRDTTVVIRSLAIGYEQRRDTLVLSGGRGVRLRVYMPASQVCLENITVF